MKGTIIHLSDFSNKSRRRSAHRSNIENDVAISAACAKMVRPLAWKDALRHASWLLHDSVSAFHIWREKIISICIELKSLSKALKMEKLLVQPMECLTPNRGILFAITVTTVYLLVLFGKWESDDGGSFIDNSTRHQKQSLSFANVESRQENSIRNLQDAAPFCSCNSCTALKYGTSLLEPIHVETKFRKFNKQETFRKKKPVRWCPKSTRSFADFFVIPAIAMVRARLDPNQVLLRQLRCLLRTNRIVSHLSRTVWSIPMSGTTMSYK